MKQPSDKILDDNFYGSNKKENPFRQKLINKIGRSMAVISFLIGTLLFLGFMMDENMSALILGFYFLPIAFIINFIYLIFLLLISGTREEKKSYRKTAGLMCLNIPIALFYLGVIFDSF